MTREETAAEWAAGQVARVRDDPSARIAPLADTYRGAVGASRRRGPFGRAAVSLMRRQGERGVLGPVDGESPGSRWWRAVNNFSIVSAYLENRDLAELESRPDRFFVNVALLRVLLAHALVAAPGLSVGRCATLAPLLGDPRLGIAGAFLSLRRVLPDRYPLDGEVEAYLVAENQLRRMIDDGVIAPRLQALYEWSAREAVRVLRATTSGRGSK